MENNLVVCFLIGMAGSGKTSLINRMSKDLNQKGQNHFIINLDPASISSSYSPNIDIKDTIDYNKVMNEYDLGPNGAIITSLNLFSTRISQIKNIMVKKKKKLNYTLIDTPGQIEVFSWSASGSIISETFSSSFPTALLYVLDVPRTSSPLTFITNVLYSCSIIYKTRLPSIMALNKKDSTSTDFLREWINDFEAFDNAVSSSQCYSGSFTRSLALALESFNQKIPTIGCSSKRDLGTILILKYLIKTNKEFNLYFQERIEKKLVGSYLKNFQSRFLSQKNPGFNIKKNSLEKEINNQCLSSCVKGDSKEYYFTLELLVLFQKETDLTRSKFFS